MTKFCKYNSDIKFKNNYYIQDKTMTISEMHFVKSF